MPIQALLPPDTYGKIILPFKVHIMIVKAFFDDNDYEFLDISSQNFNQIEEYQDKFFSWLFDKNNDHKYWVIINGNKIGCDYELGAFIDWIKTNYNVDVCKIKSNIDAEDVPILYF